MTTWCPATAEIETWHSKQTQIAEFNFVPQIIKKVVASTFQKNKVLL